MFIVEMNVHISKKRKKEEEVEGEKKT